MTATLNHPLPTNSIMLMDVLGYVASAPITIKEKHKQEAQFCTHNLIIFWKNSFRKSKNYVQYIWG